MSKMNKATEKFIRSIAIKEGIGKEIGEMREWRPLRKTKEIHTDINFMERNHLVELTKHLNQTIQIVNAMKIDAESKLVAYKQKNNGK